MKCLILIVILFCMISCASVDQNSGSWRQIFHQNNKLTNHINLYHESYGSGDPILLIHGFGGNTYSWHELIPILSRKNRVLIVDLKGFGKSPKPKKSSYSVYEQARLIIRFIQKNDLKNLTLVGHSLGGAVSLVVALNLIMYEPGLLSKLILIDSVAYKQPLPGFIRTLRLPLLGPLILALISSERMCRSVLKLAYYDDGKISDTTVAAYAEPVDSKGGKHALIKTAKNIIPKDFENLYSSYDSIKIPTLIIWGREDEIVPLWVGERLNSKISDSKLIILEECGHIPHEEKPEETIEIISRFLKYDGNKD